MLSVVLQTDNTRRGEWVELDEEVVGVGEGNHQNGDISGRGQTTYLLSNLDFIASPRLRVLLVNCIYKVHT